MNLSKLERELNKVNRKISDIIAIADEYNDWDRFNKLVDRSGELVEGLSEERLKNNHFISARMLCANFSAFSGANSICTSNVLST